MERKKFEFPTAADINGKPLELGHGGSKKSEEPSSSEEPYDETVLHNRNYYRGVVAGVDVIKATLNHALLTGNTAVANQMHEWLRKPGTKDTDN